MDYRTWYTRGTLRYSSTVLLAGTIRRAYCKGVGKGKTLKLLCLMHRPDVYRLSTGMYVLLLLYFLHHFMTPHSRFNLEYACSQHTIAYVRSTQQQRYARCR